MEEQVILLATVGPKDQVRVDRLLWEWEEWDLVATKQKSTRNTCLLWQNWARVHRPIDRKAGNNDNQTRILIILVSLTGNKLLVL